MLSHHMHVFQKEIVDSIYSKLDLNIVSDARAAEISKYILKYFPENLEEDELKKRIIKLGKDCPELSDVITKYGKAMEKAEKDPATLKNVQKLIKTGKVDDATNMIKNILSKYG